MKGSEDFLLLSQITIKRATSMLPKPPHTIAAQAIYDGLFNEKLPWRSINSNQSSTLTSPRDERVAQKILHKNLRLRNSDPEKKHLNCRLCRTQKESIMHFPICVALKPLRLFALKLLTALGFNIDKLHNRKTWLFGIDSDNEPLSVIQRAVRHIYLRVVYRNMQRQELDGIKFNAVSATREIAYEFMKRIQNFQMTRLRFYNNRKNATLPSEKNRAHLPKSAARKVMQLGKLHLNTGFLEVNPEIVKILKDQQVWKPFAID